LVSPLPQPPFGPSLTQGIGMGMGMGIAPHSRAPIACRLAHEGAEILVFPVPPSRHFSAGQPLEKPDWYATMACYSTIQSRTIGLGRPPHSMHPDQRSALISFAWNLGVGFYGGEGFDTISRRLRDKDWPKVPDALCLYCNPGTAVTAGLLRRREAEGSIWSQGISQLPAPIGYPSATSTATAAAPAAPPKPPTAKARPNPLPVPYFDQMLMSDGDGWRECFSASCGMLAKFWGKCADQNAYNAIRQTYGDTTDAQAQLKTLEHLGLDASFRMDGTLAMLKAEIDSDHDSYANWLPRWQPGGSAGWFLTCKP